MKKLSLYKSKLNLYDTQRGISLIKKLFLESLENNFNILEVRAPIYFSGNDERNFGEIFSSRSINFDSVTDYNIYTLYRNYSNWLNNTLEDLEIKNNNGIYSLVNFISRDKAIYGQKSFEDLRLVIAYKYENINNIEEKSLEIINKIYRILINLKKEINNIFPELNEKLPEELKIIDVEKLGYKDIIQELDDVKFDLLARNKWNILYFSDNFLNVKNLNNENKINNLEVLFFSNPLNTVFKLISLKIIDLKEGHSIMVNIDLDLLYLLFLEKALIYEIQSNKNNLDVEEKNKRNKIYHI